MTGLADGADRQAAGSCLVCKSMALSRCTACGAWLCDHVCAIGHALTVHSAASGRRKQAMVARRGVRL